MKLLSHLFCSALVALILLTSCVSRNPPLTCFIASIDGDPELAARIEILFRENNIVGGTGGSVIYSIKVRAQDKDKAIELLRRDSTEKGYRIQFKDGQ